MPAGVTQATTSQGTQIKMGIGSPPVLTLIPQAQGLTGPSTVQQFEDVTNLDSLGGFQEWWPALRDGGTVAFVTIAKSGDPVHAALAAANATPGTAPQSFEIDFPAGFSPSKFVFLAWVHKFELQAAQGKTLKWSVDLKVTGQVTITA